MRSAKPPTCPFCGRFIKKPEILPVGFSDFEAGVCECGSVYVCDVTGHNRGAAFVEALLLACAGDWDLAWDLDPETDYREVWIENYDLETHSIIEPSPDQKSFVRGVLCFLKLAKDIRELKDPALKELLKKEDPFTTLPPVEKKKLSRKEIENLIKQHEFDILTAYHLKEPLNLNITQRLLYHPDPVFRKKVGIALGKVCEKMEKLYPEKVIDFVKRLLYASADSAASAWGALEAVGEIIRHTGERYSIFIKNLFAFLEFPEFRPSVLYAFYRISEKHPQLLKKESYLKLLNFLKNGTPEEQGLILLIFANLKSQEVKSHFSQLNPELRFKLFDYQNLEFKEVSLGELLKTFEEV
jgi:hypothetical protein